MTRSRWVAYHLRVSGRTMMASSGYQLNVHQGRGSQPYEQLVSAALQEPFTGWNFDYLNGRVRENPLPWSYEDLALTELADSSTRLLDLNTGGGELLATLLQDREPAVAVATESWPPNLPVARQRLEPLGVEVRPSQDGRPLPAADAEFTLILNRHGACDPRELTRVLRSGGTYLMQRVGKDNDTELNTFLGGPAPDGRSTATLDHDATELAHSGLDVVDSGEAFVEYGFLDIGAVVYHLQAVPWQIPGFNVNAYEDSLRRLDHHIHVRGDFVVRHHRYFVKAHRT